MIVKSDNSSTYQFVINDILDFVESNMDVWIKCFFMFSDQSFTPNGKFIANW